MIVRGEWSGGGGGGGGGRQLVPEGGISYEWGGAAAPPKPMVDPGLVVMRVIHVHVGCHEGHVGHLWF